MYRSLSTLRRNEFSYLNRKKIRPKNSCSKKHNNSLQPRQRPPFSRNGPQLLREEHRVLKPELSRGSSPGGREQRGFEDDDRLAAEPVRPD